LGLFDLNDTKESKHDETKSNAITEVNSSTKLAAAWLPKCIEVITKRQKPKRFDAVLSI
jgi:hypothetical protein